MIDKKYEQQFFMLSNTSYYQNIKSWVKEEENKIILKMRKGDVNGKSRDELLGYINGINKLVEETDIVNKRLLKKNQEEKEK